jgi:hypothetical protein
LPNRRLIQRPDDAIGGQQNFLATTKATAYKLQA